MTIQGKSKQLYEVGEAEVCLLVTYSLLCWFMLGGFNDVMGNPVEYIEQTNEQAGSFFFAITTAATA